MSESKIIKTTPAQVIRARSATPSTVSMLDDALGIIGQQIDMFRVKSGQNQRLDEKEARILQGYIKSLVDLSKEEREREKLDDALKNMSDEELLELAKKQLESKNVSK